MNSGFFFFWESVKKALKRWLRGRQQGEWIEPWFGLKWLCCSVHKGWQLTCTTRKLQIQTHEKWTEQHVDLLWEVQLRLREVQEGFPSIIDELVEFQQVQRKEVHGIWYLFGANNLVSTVVFERRPIKSWPENLRLNVCQRWFLTVLFIYVGVRSNIYVQVKF